VSKAQTLRDKALHARALALALTDAHARAALEAMADEFERQAVELERSESGDN
jgi:hypothetical protein